MEYERVQQHIPTLCERSVAYQSAQYRTSGWARVSTTNTVQKMAMDFFLVRKE